MTRLLDKLSAPSPASRLRVGRTITAFEIVTTILFVAAFIGMFLTKQFPLLNPFVMWSFRIFIGCFVAFIVGAVVFSVVYGARNIFRLYLDTIASERYGLLGRVFWAILFLIAFVFSLFLARW
jgi:hypothetical protein